MTRFIWSAAALSFAALAVGAAIVMLTVTNPSGLIPVNGRMPPILVMLNLVRTCIPVLLVVGLGAPVSILFALAWKWNRMQVTR